MRFALVAAAVLIVAGLLAGCATPPGTNASNTANPATSSPTTESDVGLPPAPSSAADCKTAPLIPPGVRPVAVIETNMGTIRIDLYPDEAPVTVANLVCLARAHFYDGLKFHRIISGFMMQGGDPQGNGRGGPGYQIVDEFAPNLRFDKAGVLAMANSGPDTGGSQFFITFAPTDWLNDRHTIFGQATEASMAVVQKVDQEAGSQTGTPKVAVTMTRMTIVTGGSPPPVSDTPPPPPPPPCLPQGAPEGPADRQVNLITPGTWNVSADTDQILVWVRNLASARADYAFSVTGPSGSALPMGWTVTFAKASGTLQQCASRPGQGIGPQNYPDWAGTLATVTIPSSQAAGDVAAELHAGGGVMPFVFKVQPSRGTVTKVGETIQTCYDLRGEGGEAIQKGPFELEVGGELAVYGYSFGTAGLAKGESATLIVPPPFAYGQGVNELSGQTLQWAVKVVDDPATCPTG